MRKNYYILSTKQLLRNRKGKNKEPRHAFLTDLGTLITELRSNDNAESGVHSKIIIMGDFNTVFENDPQMIKFCRKYGLLDAHYEKYKTRGVATYARGKTRIDFILMSNNVYDAIIESGYTAFADIYHSDHCCQFLILSRKAIFSSASNTLPKSTYRRLQISRHRISIQYVHSLYTALVKADMFSKMSTLINATGSDQYTAEGIDSKIVSLSLEAEKQIPNRSSYDYSVDITRLRVKVKLLKLHLSVQL